MNKKEQTTPSKIIKALYGTLPVIFDGPKISHLPTKCTNSMAAEIVADQERIDEEKAKNDEDETRC